MADATSFTFQNHFHPYVRVLVQRLNEQSVDGLLDLSVQEMRDTSFFKQIYSPNDPSVAGQDPSFTVTAPDLNIDLSDAGPYSVYNWELFFHVPVGIAVHLSKNQRYAEAQRWFHHVFDPTETSESDTVPQRFWKFARFHDAQPSDMPRVDELVAVLSKLPSQLTQAEHDLLDAAERSYSFWLESPFQPHRVARTRVVAYMYYVVMKYLDNLIAWGDSLFRQDSAESVNEATQLYVLAGNILGPRPAEVPRYQQAPRMSYSQLRDAHLGDTGTAFADVLVQLENLLPFARTAASAATPAAPAASTALFGMGQTLYFCVPRNDQLAAYWDTVADRLFKIRHCQDITGVTRQLALFAPALDPGLLTQATAAGIDLAGAVAGTSAPASPVRASLLIQKALEIAAEVRSTGAALLAAMEKGDAEQLARLRQGHEIEMATRTREVRFLAWKQAEADTEALLRGRAVTFSRYRHFQLLLGRPESSVDALRDVTLTRPPDPVTEGNFATVLQDLVTSYAVTVEQETRPAPGLARDGDPQVQAGAQSQGSLDMIQNEYTELNLELPKAAELQAEATDLDIKFGVLGALPNLGLDFLPFGLGGNMEYGGELLSSVGRILSSAIRGSAEQHVFAGNRTAKIAGYQRRDLDFVQQSNQAALELMQNGRQLIAALVREQVTRADYQAAVDQVEAAKEVDDFLAGKDTSTGLYTWLRGEVARSYSERYQQAVDVARSAEQAVKRELMRPELDGTAFIGFSYWDTGHRGLQAGERLHYDLTRLQLAYLEQNKREYELTAHVSLRSLSPLALLQLRSTGSCQFAVPEWFFDLQAPGHYMRRIRTVALSLPAVTGPYTSVAATLSLQRSSVRRDPGLLDNLYARAQGEDSRFLDYPGALESVVTSSAVRDSGLFDAVARDDRYLPFEGSGAVSEWALSLPGDLRAFDYASISDAILHVSYTARPGVRADAVTSDLRARFAAATTDQPLACLFSLRYDFPDAWAAFLATAASAPAGIAGTGTGGGTAAAGTTGAGLSVRIEAGWFPYFAQSAAITVTGVGLYGIDGGQLTHATSPVTAAALTAATADLNAAGGFTVSVPSDDHVVRPDRTADPYLVVSYTIVAPQ